jgi:WD40 repeat protein
MRVGKTTTSNLQSIDPMTGEKLPPKQIPHLDDLRIYDLQTGRAAPASFRIPELRMPAINPVDGLLFSPDGRRLLVRPSRPVAFLAGKYELPPAHLLDAESLQPAAGPMQIARTSGANPQATESLNFLGAVDSLAAFCPDGRLVAFADGGNLVGVFDAATGKALGVSPSHAGRVLWARFSPDGRRLATTGSEGVARLWDTSTGAPVGPPMPHPGVVQAGFNTDGTYLLTSGGSGLIRVWGGEYADVLIKGFDFQRGVESVVLGPGPRQVVFVLQYQALPVTWEVPIEDRPLDLIEDLSIVLSGHVIDSGEGLSPASPERVEAARAGLIRREPGFFARSAPPDSSVPPEP